MSDSTIKFHFMLYELVGTALAILEDNSYLLSKVKQLIIDSTRNCNSSVQIFCSLMALIGLLLMIGLNEILETLQVLRLKYVNAKLTDQQQTVKSASS